MAQVDGNPFDIFINGKKKERIVDYNKLRNYIQLRWITDDGKKKISREFEQCGRSFDSK